MKHFLYTQRGKQYLIEHYVEKQRSTYDIADSLDTYPNMVRRALVHHGISRRTKSEAQAIAIETGRHNHPTKGRIRTEDEKQRIRDAIINNWGKT